MSAAAKCSNPSGTHAASALAGRLSQAAVVRTGESLAQRTTLRVGGPADVYVEPASEADLAAVLAFCREHRLPFFMLGRGSNLLVRDGGFRGVVICLAHPSFALVEIKGERLICGAGARLKHVTASAKKHGLAGLEFLEGIPGTLGGALRMNAGAMGGATFDIVESVRVMDAGGRVSELAPSDMDVAYRECGALRSQIALGAVVRGRPDAPDAIEARMEAFRARRRATQPAAPSAGCIFRNPADIPAGRLIDELGFKGLRAGGAVVSPEHGNFIINDGDATARDVLDLVEIIRRRARDERGLDIAIEVEIVGDD